MRKLFTFLFAALMSAGMFAATEVTITDSDFPAWGESFTKDGVTVSAYAIDGMQGNISGPGSFSTTLGNFTKIEVSAASISVSGEGWSGNYESKTWTGNASSVEFTGTINGYEEGTTLKFTIEESAPAEKPIVVFTANGNRKEVEVESFPHTFLCNYEDEDGELDGIIRELYGIQRGYCDPYGAAPSAAGNPAVEAGKQGDNHFITISEAFDGTATVSGTYYEYKDPEDEEFTYSLTISIKGDEPEPLFEISYEDKWLKVNPTDGEGQYFVFVEDKVYYDNRYTQYDQTTMQNYLDYVVGVVVGMSAQSNFVFSGEKDIDPDPIYHTWYDNDHLLINHDYVAFVFKFENDARVGDVEYLAFTYAGEPEQEEGLEHIVLTEKAKKVIVDGMIYIVRDGKLFNLTGAQVR